MKNVDKNKVVEEELSFPEGLTPSYEVRSCADIFRMYKTGQLEIHPEFQRNFVWKPTVQARFIDSLIKKLPVPSLFIGVDYKTEKHIVIDGLQRISTIIKFFENKKRRLSNLLDIDERISGKKVSDIIKESADMYQKVENLSVPVTIVRFDFSNQASVESLFTIFNRLNTGGQKLNSQEIRNCIYGGNFNSLLTEIAQSNQWKDAMGKPRKINRLENEELLLRVFAFSDHLDDYTGRLARFLNRYMDENRAMTDEEAAEKREEMLSVLALIHEKIDMPVKVHKLGRTLKEGLLVGILKNIQALESEDKAEIRSLFEDFIADEEFSEENIGAGLANRDKVQSRLKRSIEIFEP